MGLHIGYKCKCQQNLNYNLQTLGTDPDTDNNTGGNRIAHPNTHPYSHGNPESHCDFHPCANAAARATFDLVARGPP